MFETFGNDINFKDLIQLDGAFSISHIYYGESPKFYGVDARNIAILSRRNKYSSKEKIENVIDNHKDMRVVKNLYEAYDMSFKLNPYSINDLFFAQKMILSGFTIESAEFREDKVENNDSVIFDSNAIPSRFIPGAVRDIFEWYKREKGYILWKKLIF